MASTKAKTDKKSNSLSSMIGLVPLILVAITASLVLITSSEIVSYTRFVSKTKEDAAVDCIGLGGKDEQDCISEIDIDDSYDADIVYMRRSLVMTLIAITMLSVGLDAAYLSLARK